MDPDILAADAVGLEKIKAQDYRNMLAAQAADRLAFRTMVNEFVTWLKTESGKFPIEPDPAVAFRQALIIELVPKYMTTSTAIDPAAIVLDAQRDTERLKAALDELLRMQ